MTMTMTMGRSRSRSRNLSGAEAGAEPELSKMAGSGNPAQNGSILNNVAHHVQWRVERLPVVVEAAHY